MPGVRQPRQLMRRGPGGIGLTRIHDKIAALRDAGVHVVEHLGDIGPAARRICPTPPVKFSPNCFARGSQGSGSQAVIRFSDTLTAANIRGNASRDSADRDVSQDPQASQHDRGRIPLALARHFPAGMRFGHAGAMISRRIMTLPAFLNASRVHSPAPNPASNDDPVLHTTSIIADTIPMAPKSPRPPRRSSTSKGRWRSGALTIDVVQAQSHACRERAPSRSPTRHLLVGRRPVSVPAQSVPSQHRPAAAVPSLGVCRAC
jgi:hypothetical protein